MKKPKRLQRRALRYETDLKLTLYKHWTVEEAMFHSSYFYGALELNREKGGRALKNFFAMIGISPKEYSQIYSCMKLRTRTNLQDMYSQKGGHYGLDENMFIDQIVRDFGIDREHRNVLRFHEMSSMDAAYLVTSILTSVPNSLSSGQMEALPKNSDGTRDAVAVQEMERKELVANFWRATDAVLGKDTAVLTHSLQEAVDQAKELQRLARRIIDAKMVGLNETSEFRFVKIEQCPHVFRHQLAVRRLAVWLLHVLFTYKPGFGRRGDEDKPFLVIVRDVIRDTYLCVGTGSPRFEAQNEFGQRFRHVIKMDSTLQYQYDSFDRSVVEIHSKDFDRFWKALNRT